MAKRLLTLLVANLVFLLAKPTSGENSFFRILSYMNQQSLPECPAKYFSSTYDEPCMDRCDKHGYSYYWCKTKKGWDYCSPAAGVDYEGRACQSACTNYGGKYKKCWVDAGTTWSRCAQVEPKPLSHYTQYSKKCLDDCQYYQRGDYFWCHTEDNWDYCSPLIDYTYRGQPCRYGDKCTFAGKSYSWCYTSFRGDWDYCGQVLPGECSYVSGSHRKKRQLDELVLICTRKDNNSGRKTETLFLDKGGQRYITKVDGKLQNEVQDLIDAWKKKFRLQPRSNQKSKNFRIDLQGTFSNNGRTYYNLQIQCNKPRGKGKSTTVAQILVPEDTSAEYMCLAFKHSFERGTRVQIEVRDVDSIQNNIYCTPRKQ